MRKVKKDELICELEQEYASWYKADRPNTRMGSAQYTNALYPYKNLFSPTEYNGLTVKNKVVYIPELGFDLALENGAPSDSFVSFFLDRAQGGTGLLCTTPVAVGTSAFTAASWRELTEGIHARGAYIFAQFDLESVKLDPSAALSLDAGYTKMIKLAGQAAANAVTSGFDGICLCGVAGTVLDLMSSKAWNRKILSKYSDPCRFGTDLVEQIRERTNAQLPILYRIVLSHAVSESYGDAVSAEKELKSALKQRRIADTLDYMEKLVSAGVDMFEVGLGCAETPWLLSPAAAMPAGCYLDAARAVTDYFMAIGLRANSGKPVCIIGSGKLECPDIAESALRNGLCSAVAPGSAITADSSWCAKASQGKCDEIIPFYAGAPKEPFHVIPSPRKRTAVVGGGMRGMLFALEAARNGHRVDLYESSDTLGGKLLALSRPAVNCAAGSYLSSLVRRVNKCRNISVKLRTSADADILKAGNYESIVFAPGKSFSVPGIAGWGTIPFVYAYDIMKRPSSLPDVAGKNVAVIGGSELGCTCAWWLKSEKGCGRIAVIEEGSRIMDGCAENDRTWMIHQLDLSGAQLATMSVPSKIADGWLYFEENAVGAKPAANCTWVSEASFEVASDETTLRCVRPDLIVIAADGKVNSTLYEEAMLMKIAPEIKII